MSHATLGFTEYDGKTKMTNHVGKRIFFSFSDNNGRFIIPVLGEGW